MSSDSHKSELSQEVDFLIDFVNTRDVEEGTDAIAEPGQLGEWIAERTGEVLAEPKAAEVERLHDLREALRGLMLANNGGEVGERDLEPVREAAERSRFRLVFDAENGLALTPARADLSGFEASLLLAVEHLQCHDAWPRLKACTDETCHWAFYDATRNRSRTWCSMDVCGNRQKTKRYRQRKTSA
ncbi:MAG TPA: CGNR zinc finger domain-containing protein [Solirubrobacterales bacterium]|nr:CGNR zinc finger domain-containing protein [Solirubrobacterales bacterium]